MTQIKIEVPANDHIALSAMADALQRIADERAPSATTGDAAWKQMDKIYAEHNENTPKGVTQGEPCVQPVDVELNRLDEELEAHIHHENTKHDEAFEEGVAATEQDDTLDADGIPHDKRIHSKGATRLADNTWRLRKRPADKTEEEWTTYIDSVKAELKAVQAITLAPLETTVTETVQLNEGVTIDDVAKSVESLFEGGLVIDEQTTAHLTPPVIETREGPFYWSHDESDSCGEVQTLEQLREILDSDPLCNQIDKDSYDKRVEIGYDNSVNNVTPPVIDTDTPSGMSEANETPVAPVTPPTSLTPPVVEADKPSVTTFQELMLYMTSDAKKRGADNDMIKATLLEVDPALTAIPLIATRADLIPKFVEALEAKLK